MKATEEKEGYCLCSSLGFCFLFFFPSSWVNFPADEREREQCYTGALFCWKTGIPERTLLMNWAPFKPATRLLQWYETGQPLLSNLLLVFTPFGGQKCYRYVLLIKASLVLSGISCLKMFGPDQISHLPPAWRQLAWKALWEDWLVSILTGSNS